VAKPEALTGPLLAGARVLPVLTSLGISIDGIDASHDYREATVRQLIEETPRHVSLGSTPEQLRSAYSLCRQYGANCSFDDETVRRVTLRPFELDAHPVSVREFREFTQRTHYETVAEKQGVAYIMVDGRLKEVPGGSWRNAVKQRPLEDDAPVVGISYPDAVAFCKTKSSRLPTENEWEYVARGPQHNVFPWGNEVATAARSLSIAPHVTDGPAQGIGGRYKGLAGEVWQWVDTRVADHRVLKGASWLEANPANQRAAVRTYSPIPELAFDDSGFRCAHSATVWPDADLWLSQLR
jgi:formylglycine-generating enzyme required for sulfatase activity